MALRNRVPAAKVFGYWLKTEFDGRESFRKHVRRTVPLKYRRLIRRQDLTNEFENEIRYAMLLSYRNFAADYRCAEWWEEELERSDLRRIRVIHSSHWAELSGGTLRAVDIARRIAEYDALPVRLKRLGEVQTFEDDSKTDARERSMLIVVRTRGERDITVIDGVHRTIRYCLHYLVRKDLPWEGKRMYLGVLPRHGLHNQAVRKALKARPKQTG